MLISVEQITAELITVANHDSVLFMTRSLAVTCLFTLKKTPKAKNFALV